MLFKTINSGLIVLKVAGLIFPNKTSGTPIKTPFLVENTQKTFTAV